MEKLPQCVLERLKREPITWTQDGDDTGSLRKLAADDAGVYYLRMVDGKDVESNTIDFVTISVIEHAWQERLEDHGITIFKFGGLYVPCQWWPGGTLMHIGNGRKTRLEALCAALTYLEGK